MAHYELDIAKIMQSADCIAAYDKELNVLLWNPAIEAKYQISSDAAIGRNLLQLFPQLQNDFRVRCLVTAAIEHKTFFFPSLPYLFGPGMYTQLVMPVNRQTAGFDGVLSIVRDHDGVAVFRRPDLLQPLIKETSPAAP